jgi:hypothetical protein
MMYPKGFVEKILGKIHKEDGPLTTHCWVWQGYRDWKGYGKTSYRHRTLSVHRVMYEISNGPIPGELYVLHKCDCQLCCNPEHLFVGNQLDNIEDMIAKGRRPKQYGEFNGRSKLTADEVRQIKVKIADGATDKALGEEYRMSQDAIGNIRRGKNWKHIKV